MPTDPIVKHNVWNPWTPSIGPSTVVAISAGDDMGDRMFLEVCTSLYRRFSKLNDCRLRNSAREMKPTRRRPAEVASRLRLPPQLRAWRILGLL